MKALYLFGDSIGYGCWDLENGGWAAQFKKALDIKQKAGDVPLFYFYNLSIPGNTSQHLLKRFTQEYEARQRSDDSERIVLIAIGANDATYKTDTNQFKVPVEEYCTNMTSVIKMAKSSANKVFILNTTPVDDERATSFEGKAKCCKNEYVDEYNQVLREISETEEVRVIDVHSAIREGGLAMLDEDGLHLTPAGHKRYFERLTPLLEGL